MNPCIFAVNVLSDGVGDLFHFVDFLSVLSEDELQDAYFVIKIPHRDSNFPQYQKIMSIIKDLDESHPLKKYKDKITFMNEHDEEISISF